MSVLIPGLSLSTQEDHRAPSPPPVPSTRTISLSPGTEWRFEASLRLNLRLLSGTAEIFGTEIGPSTKYSLGGRQAAVYTWQGCELEIEGDCDSEYVAEETPMNVYLNLHGYLEQEKDRGDGPRVMVVGPSSTGKTSLARTLCAYATRQGRQPVVVNLDPGEGLLSIPGSLTIAAMTTMTDVEESWGTSPVSGPTPATVKMPLVYHYGHQSPDSAPDVFKAITTRMALATTSRAEEDPRVKQTGFIIDTPSALAQLKNQDLLRHVISEFSVNILLVLGSDKLYNEMIRAYASNMSDVAVVKVPSSSGCVSRDEKAMAAIREAQIRAYFFGSTTSLSPHAQTVDFGLLPLLEYSKSSHFSSSASKHDSFRPLGDEGGPEQHNPDIFDKVEPSMKHIYGIIAIKFADPTDTQEAIRDAAVMGFLYVADVKPESKQVKVLSPISGRLPRKAMVFSEWPGAIADLVG